METDRAAAGVEKQVFSLWPTPAGMAPAPGEAVPAWVRDAAPRRAAKLDPVVGSLGFGLLCVLAAGATATPSAAPAAGICLLAAASLVGSLVLYRRRRAADGAETLWREALFERPGISLWREDWSAVGAAILELKRAGVHDIGAWYAAHPDAARALRRQVIVKDVNAFAVQMMGARSKADLVGTLDRILPDSDQTFDQWLIAFGRGD
ncbi:MAG TPA: hypothetical protein VEA15_04545, partial [Caulobacteraceae bacterium]|nr:hypothetical protein [Caulobacteraceae bacterium]